MNLICKLHDGQNANQYCNKCGTYACQQCAQEQHKGHQDCMKVVIYSQIQEEIQSKIATAQSEIDRLNEYIRKLSHFESEAQTVDINEFQNALNSMPTPGSQVQTQDTADSTPSNSGSETSNPMELVQTQQPILSREESKKSSTLQIQLSTNQFPREAEQPERIFDAFGFQSKLSANQKLKNSIRNNSYDPMSLNRQCVKFSYSCFKHLDEILLISEKLEALKEQYNYVFLDYEIKDYVCNIYINTIMKVWDDVLSEIENYMPHMQILPMRDIKRGFEQIISQEIYSGDTFYSEENEPKLIANQGAMVISVFNRDQAELHHITELISGFILREYQNQYDLFELCDYTDFAGRAHIAIYLKKYELIDKVLQRNGYEEKKIDYRTHKQKIYVKATQNEYDDFVQDVRQAIQSVNTGTAKLLLRIHVMKTYLSKGQTLQQKVQKKFDVYVSEVFKVVQTTNEETNLTQQICEYVSIPTITGIDKELQYEIQLTGTQADEAFEYINSLLYDYSYVELRLSHMSSAQYSNLIKMVEPIKQQYRVTCFLVKGSFHIYGKKSHGRLEKFLKSLKALIPKHIKKN
eukprot:403334128